MAKSYMEELIYVIGHNESGNNYDSVNPVDVVSIGLFNWYGARALSLARSIVSVDPSGSRAALEGSPSDIYGQITSGNNNVWNSWRPGDNKTDMQKLKEFLRLQASMNEQDTLAMKDGEMYSSQAKSTGITVAAAQLYYADLYNQSPKQAVAIVKAAGGGALCNLERIHEFAMKNEVMSKYSTRRNWTYNELLSWQGETPTEPDIPVTPPVNPPDDGNGNMPSLSGAKKWFMVQQGYAVEYSDDFPKGILYIQSGVNMYIPYSPIPPLDPIKVVRLTDMTDTGRVYVLLPLNYLYIWDGYEWKNTGIKYKE